MKTILVTSSQVKLQKKLLLILSICMIAFSIITFYMVLWEREYMILFNLPLFGVLVYIFIKDIKRIKSISFDNKAVYIGTDRNTPITQISLENIRSIIIGQFDQSYRLHLVNPVNSEKHIYFKFPGLWMHFGPKLKRGLIFDLRNKIDDCKKCDDPDFNDETQIIEMVKF